jgi:hypothetical protein
MASSNAFFASDLQSRLANAATSQERTSDDRDGGKNECDTKTSSNI